MSTDLVGHDLEQFALPLLRDHGHIDPLVQLPRERLRQLPAQHIRYLVPSLLDGVGLVQRGLDASFVVIVTTEGGGGVGKSGNLSCMSKVQQTGKELVLSRGGWLGLVWPEEGMLRTNKRKPSQKVAIRVAEEGWSGLASAKENCRSSWGVP